MIDPPHIKQGEEELPVSWFRKTHQWNRQNTPTLGTGVLVNSTSGGASSRRLPPPNQRRAIYYCLFPVRVTQDGGSAGNSTTTCSFTYTVKDIRNNTLGTGMAPAFSPARVIQCACTKAPDDSYGTAFYDKTGAVALGFVQETQQQTNC